MYYDLRETFDLVRANLNANEKLQKAAYDKKKGFHTSYKENDLVLVWKPLSPSIKQFRKFKTSYSGPWIVMKVLSPWTYLVKHVKTLKQNVVHFDTMKLIPTNLRYNVDEPTQLDSAPNLTSPPDPENPLPEGSEPLDDIDITKLMFGTSTNPPEPGNDLEDPISEAIPPETPTDNTTNSEPYHLRPRKQFTYTK